MLNDFTLREACEVAARMGSTVEILKVLNASKALRHPTALQRCGRERLELLLGLKSEPEGEQMSQNELSRVLETLGEDAAPAAPL